MCPPCVRGCVDVCVLVAVHTHTVASSFQSFCWLLMSVRCSAFLPFFFLNAKIRISSTGRVQYVCADTRSVILVEHSSQCISIENKRH